MAGVAVNIAYCGNFSAPHSTENEVRKALDKLGHDVWLCQEGERSRFDELVDRVHEFDVVLWTRTKDLCDRIDRDALRALLIKARRAGVPTVGFHLDRFWGLGLGREESVWTEPFFRCEYFFQTDGAHDAEFAAAGVNAIWMPPAVSEFECVPGTPRDEWRADVGFLGTVAGYHRENAHRFELVRFLRDTYGDRFRQFPGDHRPGIRGADLRDLIASVKVWVGDSCLSPRKDGRPMVKYISDRVPEITGRGGFLLHPEVEGVFPECWAANEVVTWQLGCWDELGLTIDHYLANDDEREKVAAAGKARTMRDHVYTQRLREVLAEVVQ